MSQDKLTPEQRDKMVEFFNHTIDVEAFAIEMRKLLFTTAYNYISKDPDTFPRDIEGGYYWLTEFIEILSPTMDD